MAQLSLDELTWGDALGCQVRRACVVESLSLAVLSHLSSGTMRDVPVAVRLKLRGLAFNLHANCLVFLDLLRLRWMAEGPGVERVKGHRSHRLDFKILQEEGHYRTLRDGEHVTALEKNTDTIFDILLTLCGSTSSRPANTTSGNSDILRSVSSILQGDVLERLQVRRVRSNILQMLRFEPLCEDRYERFGKQRFAKDCAAVEFEPHPPVIADVDVVAFLPRQQSRAGDLYTLVLDLDETLVHSPKGDISAMGVRPGTSRFLQKMSALGYEIVTFTTATQEYADSVIAKIDPHGLIQHRLYRQHTLPWGGVHIKDLSRLGRDLSRTMIIDNIADNFMLQPDNGITVADWLGDPQDQVLCDLVSLLEELVKTRTSVPDILNKYAKQIPMWAGFGKTQKSTKFSHQMFGECAGLSDGQNGSEVGSQLKPELPMYQDFMHSANMPFVPTVVPVMMQVQTCFFFDPSASLVPSPAVAPMQSQVMLQPTTCVAPPVKEYPPNSPEGTAAKGSRRGIKNRKIDPRQPVAELQVQ